MTITVSKEQVLAKMQEFDVALQAVNAAMQTMITVRTELWSMVSDLPDNEQFAKANIPLTFYENGHIIAWGNDSEHFRPSTFRFLQQLWLATDNTLSKEDVRQDVIGDEYASDLAVRHVINKARKELENVGFPYEIETLRGKGYKLKHREQLFPI